MQILCVKYTRYNSCSSRRGLINAFFFFSSRRRHTRSDRDWSSDVCSSDLTGGTPFKALVGGEALPQDLADQLIARDRKSTRLNSSHDQISYAVFCLKKKKKKKE